MRNIRIGILLGLACIGCIYIILAIFEKTRTNTANSISKTLQEKANYENEKLFDSVKRDILKTINAVDIMTAKSVCTSQEIKLKSKQAVDNYKKKDFYRDNSQNLEEIKSKLMDKYCVIIALDTIIDKNEESYKNHSCWLKVKGFIEDEIKAIHSYYTLHIFYVSPAGRSYYDKIIKITLNDIQEALDNPEQYMTKSELREVKKQEELNKLNKIQQHLCTSINTIIDCISSSKENILNKENIIELETIAQKLVNLGVNVIPKIKSPDGDKIYPVEAVIKDAKQRVSKIVEENNEVIEYYKSSEFVNLKKACESLMLSQKEFNDYIEQKVNSISTYLGNAVVRNDTIVEDKHNYIRPYKKALTSFIANVSGAVFASAENNPIDYIIKYFYPDKQDYPKQIQKLKLLVGELESLREAKDIIEKRKEVYKDYIKNVPSYVIERDEKGFYKRLGFISITENDLSINYSFTYTSDGGFTQKSFDVPMTEETINNLIGKLESKLTLKEFAKEQRALMTVKLRSKIKERDNYTCQCCGNSTHEEPNLLLEIDHIIPIAKGGITSEENLQTLCWKCNRSKSDKM